MEPQTHVVTNIVRYGGRIPRVIFRDTSLYLSHQVSPDIGGLGIDTATHTGEKGLGGSPHPESQHRGGYHHELLRTLGLHEGIEDYVPYGNVEQPEPHYRQPHDGAGAESYLEPGIQGAHRGIRGPCGSIRGRLHAHEAREPGKEAARKEGERHPAVLHPETVGKDSEKDGQDDKDYGHHLVLLLKIGHRPFPYEKRDFLHGGRTLALLHHLTEKIPCETQSGHGRCRDQIEQVDHLQLFLKLSVKCRYI